MPTCPKCAGRFEDAQFCPRDGTGLIGDVGRVLGDRYRLLRKVGEGAMGEVFEALHVHINRRVAVKLLHRKLATDVDARRRLQREAQSTSGIEHPNIVESLDFGFTPDGQPYLVMEWLDGKTLDERLDAGLLSLDVALDIAMQAAAGLHEAHERGVIHRDLKPANIFLVRDRKGQLVVKVLDFGIAKLGLGVQDAKLTGTGAVIGTPIYMAPEQAFGEAVDARTDVYALGVILFEMLAGSVPFTGESPLAVLHQHTAKIPIAPSLRAPQRGITPELDMLVLRCLAKHPQQRFASMQQLLSTLAAARKRLAARPAVPALRAVYKDDDDVVPATHSGRTIAIVLGAAAIVSGAAAVMMTRATETAAPSDTGSVLSRMVAPPVPTAVTPASDAGAAVARQASARRQRDHASAPTSPRPTRSASDASSRAPQTITGEAAELAFTATITPARPSPGEPVEIAFTLREPSDRVREALAAGNIDAKLSIEYFRDHAVVHDSVHRLDADARFTTSVVLARNAKHHVRVRLIATDGELATASFDILSGT